MILRDTLIIKENIISEMEETIQRQNKMISCIKKNKIMGL